MLDSDSEKGVRRRARHLAKCIDPQWCSRASTDADLRRDLAAILGPVLAEGRIQLTAVSGTLIIACRDRATATDLRFLQREIRKTLHAAGRQGIEHVRIVLSAPQVDPGPTHHPDTRHVMPATAVAALRLTASDIDDTELSDALRRLAKLGEQGPPNR